MSKKLKAMTSKYPLTLSVTVNKNNISVLRNGIVRLHNVVKKNIIVLRNGRVSLHNVVKKNISVARNDIVNLHNVVINVVTMNLNFFSKFNRLIT